MILTSTRTRTTVATDETSHVVRQRMRQATEAAVSGDLRGLHRQDHTEPGEDGVYVRADNAAAVAGRNTSAELPCNQDRLVSGERARFDSEVEALAYAKLCDRPVTRHEVPKMVRISWQ